MVATGTLIYGLLWAWYARANQRRASGEISEKHSDLSEEELMELGDESPRYTYTI